MAESGESVARLPKVLIGLPNRNAMPSSFVETMDHALIGVGSVFEGYKLYLNRFIPDEARNKCVEKALELDVDFIFFMDTDMLFPKGCVAQMIKHATKIKDDKPFVLGGLYNHVGDGRLNVYEWAEEHNGYKSMLLPLYSGIREVSAIATGCMLLDINVFKVIGWPWFEYKYMIDPLGDKVRWSEDMVFCKKLNDTGIPIYADTDIVCGHLTTVSIWQTDQSNFEVRKLNGELF